MAFSYVSHLYCSACEKTYESTKPQQLCTCGAPLLVQYDLESLKQSFRKEDLVNRSNDLWRYHELLPVLSEEHVVSLGEGMTPLLSMPRLSEELDIEQVYMKDEGMIPTGSFKARGSAVGVSKAKELGIQTLAMPTNGNAGAAWSLYAARAGIESTIVMPVDAPKITRNECAMAGAHLYLVNGLISDAGKMVGEYVKESGAFDASTLKEPYRIEGKKTMGIEIAEQLNWEMPDVIVYPTGGGVGIIGIYKALNELKELGWIEGSLPKLVAVQSTGCAPIVKAWENGERHSEYWEDADTMAFGINVPKAIGDFLVLDAVYETEGWAIAIEDEAIAEEQQAIAKSEGAFVCPEGGAAFAAIRRLRNAGRIKRNERVVALNTGAGIKYPDTVNVEVPVLEKEEQL
ncbi:threonine synthase [Salsuginibacillus kocurii]|uniref:threonine synthase n=1 Tax=Salsuginibacillus kocurii TaxID=427078 RepID=UPI000360CEA2|nr:threonine synthase [Salsuginibacillus kocurii]